MGQTLYGPHRDDLDFSIDGLEAKSGASQGQMKSYEELISSFPPNEPKVEHEEGDLLFLQYSGGTTALPKQVMHTRKSALPTTLNTILNWRLVPDDVYLSLAPHYWGQMLQLFCAIFYMGCTSIFLSDINPKSILETIEEERVTTSLMGGALLSPLVDHQNTGKYNLSSLRHLSVGGVPVPPEVEKKAIETLGNVIGHLYGMTEHTFLTILHPEELTTDESAEKTGRLRSSGRAGLNIRLRIVDDNGNDVALGQVGEIITAGYGMMEGYWKAPEATREAMMGSYLCTGDLAMMDEQGYVYHAGRKKDVIVTEGKTVSPTEVEELISGYSPVQEAAVIGVPDKELGQAVKAIIVLTDGMDNQSTADADDALSSIGFGGLSISTVGFGQIPEGDEEADVYSGIDESTLRYIAENAGGKYGYVENKEQLSALYDQMRRSLQSEVVISYETLLTLRDGVLRALTVTLSDRYSGVGGESQTSFNPGGLVPEVAQPASQMTFGVILAVLVVLLFIPVVILVVRNKKPKKRKIKITLKD